MRPILAAAAALASAALAAAAAARPLETFGEADFDGAQGAGKIVVLHFRAQGCRFCDDQAKALERLLDKPPFQEIAGFEADYDTGADLVRRLRVSGRATLILFKGREELARAVGISTESEIRAFLRKAFPEKRRGRPKARPSNRTQPRP